ncbi:DUF1648 domain-containing protein, partial [Corynebacterium striatum]
THAYTLRGPSTKECPKTTPGTRYPHRSVLDTALPVLNSVARHATAALALVAAIVVIAGWDSLPDPLPKHFNGRDEPDAWMPKTYRNAIGFAVLVPIILTIVSAVTIGITQQSTKTTTGSYSQSSAVDIERSRAHAAAILPALSFWFLH